MLNLEDLKITAGISKPKYNYDNIDDKPLTYVSFINQAFENIRVTDFAIETIEQNMFHMALASNTIDELKKYNSSEAWEFENKYDFSLEGVMDSIGEGLRKIWEFIKSVFKKIIEILKKFFKWVASLFSGNEAEECEKAAKKRKKVTKAVKDNAGKPASSKGLITLPVGENKDDKGKAKDDKPKKGKGTVEDVSKQTISMNGVDNKTWSKNPKKTVAYIKAYSQTASQEILDAMTRYQKEMSEVSKNGIKNGLDTILQSHASKMFDKIIEVQATQWTVNKILYGVDKVSKFKYTYLQINELIPDELLYRNVYEAIELLAKKEQQIQFASNVALKWMEKVDKMIPDGNSELPEIDKKNKEFKALISLVKKSKDVITSNVKFSVGLSKEIETVRKNALKAYKSLEKSVEAYL